MPIVLDQNELQYVICLEGEIDIASAAELKKLLLEALASGKELRVDLARATELDVTALQLFWAAGREASAAGVGFNLAGEVPAAITSTLGDAGFEQFPIPAEQSETR